MTGDWAMLIAYTVVTLLGWLAMLTMLSWKQGKRDQLLSDTAKQTKKNSLEYDELQLSVKEIRSKTIDNGLVDDIKRIEANIAASRNEMNNGFVRVNERIDGILQN